MMSWRYSVAPRVSGGTRGGQNFLRDREGGKTALELLNRSENRRGVVGHENSKGDMLQRHAQLLLFAENHHFEGQAKFSEPIFQISRHLFKFRRTSDFLIRSSMSISDFRLAEFRLGFKVIVLGDQEGLCVSLHHVTFRIIMSHDSPAIFRAIEQL